MYTLIVFLLASIGYTNSAKILCIFPTPSMSHQSVFQPVWKELSLRGHQVTVITPNPLKNSSLNNLTEIDVSEAYKIQEQTEKDLSNSEGWKDVMDIAFFLNMPVYEYMLQHPEVSKLIEDGRESFDLIMIEFVQPLFFAFAGKIKVPVVAITSLAELMQTYESLSAPYHPYITFSDVTDSFLNRLMITEFFWYTYDYFHYRVLPHQNALAKKYFGDDIPHLGDILKNISLAFVTRNVFLNQPRLLPPNIIEISRVNIKQDEQLPTVNHSKKMFRQIINYCFFKDLQEFLDSAPEGAIYFSLGSSVKTYMLEENKIRIILQALSELPYKTLWKFENETLEVPDNVLIKRWLPQQDVLRHKNVKVFVTQGGMQSLEEAIHFRVPLVGVPLMSDHPLNIQRMVKAGVCVRVDFKNLSVQDLKKAIEEVKNNSR